MTEKNPSPFLGGGPVICWNKFPRKKREGIREIICDRCILVRREVSLWTYFAFARSIRDGDTLKPVRVVPISKLEGTRKTLKLGLHWIITKMAKRWFFRRKKMFSDIFHDFVPSLPNFSRVRNKIRISNYAESDQRSKMVKKHLYPKTRARLRAWIGSVPFWYTCFFDARKDAART